MGGRITVASEPGSGSAFGFFVVVELAASRPTVEGGRLKGMRAAMVQDNARAGETLRAMLRAVGMEVSLFSHPEQLLKAYRPGTWQVILADLRSPAMAGIELVRALDGTPRPPVILMTPLGSSEVSQPGVAAILRKPVPPTLLLAALEKVLGVDHESDADEGRMSDKRPDFTGMSVLVAEDNTVNQQVVVGMLEKLGVSATVVTNGQEAVANAVDGCYDLVLMDVQMPRMDGLEAARRIRSACGESPYIAAMTANAQQTDRDACLDAGMDDFISKRVRIDDLERRLREALARSRNGESKT
jgi:CheY-like chemotaxis protein